MSWMQQQQVLLRSRGGNSGQYMYRRLQLPDLWRNSPLQHVAKTSTKLNVLVINLSEGMQTGPVPCLLSASVCLLRMFHCSLCSERVQEWHTHSWPHLCCPNPYSFCLHARRLHEQQQLLSRINMKCRHELHASMTQRSWQHDSYINLASSALLFTIQLYHKQKALEWASYRAVAAHQASIASRSLCAS